MKKIWADFSADLNNKIFRKMEIEFLEWYSKNEDRFAHGQFDEKQVAYSAWLDGKQRNTKAENLPISDVTISSTNSELGSYHWFHTIISRHKSIGEFLKDRIPEKHLIHQWGQKLYETSQELIKGLNTSIESELMVTVGDKYSCELKKIEK